MDLTMDPTMDPRTTRIKWYYFFSENLFILAVVLSIMASISLPYSSWLYIAQTHFDGTATVIQTSEGLSHNLSEIRFGIWGVCYYDSETSNCKKINDHRVIIKQGKNATIEVDWVREWHALIAQPIVTSVSGLVIITKVAIKWSRECYEFPPMTTHLHNYMRFMENFGYFFTMIVTMATLVSMAVFDIIFYNLIKSKLHNGVTRHGLGFTFTLLSAGILLILCVCHIGAIKYERIVERDERLRPGREWDQRIADGVNRINGEAFRLRNLLPRGDDSEIF